MVCSLSDMPHDKDKKRMLLYKKWLLLQFGLTVLKIYAGMPTYVSILCRAEYYHNQISCCVITETKCQNL